MFIRLFFCILFAEGMCLSETQKSCILLDCHSVIHSIGVSNFIPSECLYSNNLSVYVIACDMRVVVFRGTDVVEMSFIVKTDSCISRYN